MDERADEHGIAAQLIDDAPGVRGDLADVGVIEFGPALADARVSGSVAARARMSRTTALGSTSDS